MYYKPSFKKQTWISWHAQCIDIDDHSLNVESASQLSFMQIQCLNFDMSSFCSVCIYIINFDMSSMTKLILCNFFLGIWLKTKLKRNFRSFQCNCFIVWSGSSPLFDHSNVAALLFDRDPRFRKEIWSSNTTNSSPSKLSPYQAQLARRIAFN